MYKKSRINSVREWVNLCVITHGSTSARSLQIQTYLSLLLLPGGVQQQVPVPVILLGHVHGFIVDRVGVAVCHVGFDSCHHAAFVRTSRPPHFMRKKLISSSRRREGNSHLETLSGGETEVPVRRWCSHYQKTLLAWCSFLVKSGTRDRTPISMGTDSLGIRFWP